MTYDNATHPTTPIYLSATPPSPATQSPNPAIEDYLDIEYQTNLECHEGNPLACEIIVPTHCYAKAGSQSNDGAEKGLRWDDEGFLRVLISVGPRSMIFFGFLRIGVDVSTDDVVKDMAYGPSHWTTN